jgi:hypothetical protein
MKENYTEQIDRTLRLLGSVHPAAGMEDRILASIAHAQSSNRAQRFFRLPQLAFGMAAAVVASVVIVAGSVSHSRQMLPVAPGLHLPTAVQPGVGAASAAHVAQQTVTSLPQDRPRSVRKTVNGRAVISPNAKKQAGVAVPKTLPSQQ